MSFINRSYFAYELVISNMAEPTVSARVDWFIQKYEPEFLLKLLGYPLYNQFMVGMNVVSPATPDIRWLNLLFGCEYTNIYGAVTRWKGLIVTDTPQYNLGGGLVYRKPEYLVAGVTPGIVAGSSSFTFDGTAGKVDWRGWTPILFRGNAPLTPGVDYSWDKDAGTLTLLSIGDKFLQGEQMNAQFELRTDAVPNGVTTNNLSPIANYVYYWFMRNNSTQTTATGETRTKSETSETVSPRQKMISAWNEMHRWVKEYVAFMDQSQTVYPEWTYNNKMVALKYFGFINPIF